MDKRTATAARMTLQSGPGTRVLILEAPYYEDITQALVDGALEVLGSAGVGADRIAVPGAHELPQALVAAQAAGVIAAPPKAAKYAGVIVLGCVIRGETAHYDIVCNNANHWLMHTAIGHHIPLGNGVLTVDTHAQALARATGGASGKGGDAARACLRLIWLATHFENLRS